MPFAVTLRPPGVSSEGRYFVAEFDCVASGTYAGSGGDTANFAVPGMAGFGVPSVVFTGKSVGYVYKYTPGTSLADGKFKVLDDALAEHANATYNAAVSGVTIRAIVRIPKYKR